MAKLTMDLNDSPSVKEKIEIQQEVPVTPKFRQRSPNSWDIKPGIETEIIAQSDLGDKFTGTVAEFNKLLRA